MSKPVRIAVISDVHFGAGESSGARRCDIADVLLKRTVLRLNRLVKPDVTVVLGDLVDDGESSRAGEDLASMRAILDTLDSPYIAIPGNHDGDVDQFYTAFERPANMVDLKGIRFLPFIDKGEPRYWASRSQADIDRMEEARDGFSGPIVSLQHVCLHDPARGHVPPYYNYTNAEEVIAAMQAAGVSLSISGHHHAGADDSWCGDVMFVNSPGLCEAPFPFLVITIEDGQIQTKRNELVMSKAYKLVDSHVHTQLAYCAENMDVEKSIELAKEFGLAGITFTEHSGQLYFDRKPYWRNKWLENGMAAADPQHSRMDQYLALKESYEDDFARFSLEVECDSHGELLLYAQDLKSFPKIMGTIHAVPGLGKEQEPSEKNCNDFLYLVESMCRKGVKVLAHPLRVFGRLGWDVPGVLYAATAEILARHGVAAELNFHSNHLPSPVFVRECLARGVKFSFGSDSHNLAEIGDFAYQLALLEESGFDGDLPDILSAPF